MHEEISLLKDRLDLQELKNQALETRFSNNQQQMQPKVYSSHIFGDTNQTNNGPSSLIEEVETRVMQALNEQAQVFALDMQSLEAQFK
jgi:hypothetical protein